MPNVIDIEPVHELVRHAVKTIQDPATVLRFQKIAFDRLLQDPRNFRPALPPEIASGPDWARAAHARGDIVSVFEPYKNAAVRLRTVARRLADTLVIAKGEVVGEPRCDEAVFEARRFLAKFDRVNFDVAARKALRFSRLREQWEADRDAVELCQPQSVAATLGRIWWRTVSIAGLRKIGREFHNCLASSTRSSSYVSLLRRGMAQLWVLRDANGVGLIVAMASTGKGARFTEVKGPHNSVIPPDHPDLTLLTDKLGLRAREQAPIPVQFSVFSTRAADVAQMSLSIMELLNLTAPRDTRRH